MAAVAGVPSKAPVVSFRTGLQNGSNGVPFRPGKRVFPQDNRETMSSSPSMAPTKVEVDGFIYGTRKRPGEDMAGLCEKDIHKSEAFGGTQRKHVGIMQAQSPSHAHDHRFGEHYAGAASHCDHKACHLKASPCGPKNDAVADELVFGRDIDRSARNPRKAALDEWSKDAAGQRSPRQADMGQILTGRSLSPAAKKNWQGDGSAAGLHHQEVNAEWNPSRLMRSHKDGLPMGTIVGDLVFNIDASYDPKYQETYQEVAGFSPKSSARICPRNSGRPHRCCNKCQQQYSGFGEVCGACRPLLKTGGTQRACCRCGEFYHGYGNTCGDCNKH